MGRKQLLFVKFIPRNSHPVPFDSSLHGYSVAMAVIALVVHSLPTVTEGCPS